MANSQYEYVRTFESPDSLLPNSWIVVRIDGRGFHKFSTRYNFEKPNDKHALDLMNAAAHAVVTELPDVSIAYGEDRVATRSELEEIADAVISKLVTTVVSAFSSYYIYLWPKYFPDSPLSPPLPSFDGRIVLYPSAENLRDYMSWRQVDCHINNLYNTAFWALIQIGGKTARDAEQILAGTLSADKNEILFKFGINYNKEPEMYKKGSIICKDIVNTDDDESKPKHRGKAQITVQHLDLIKDGFWNQRPWILSGKAGRTQKEP